MIRVPWNPTYQGVFDPLAAAGGGIVTSGRTALARGGSYLDDLFRGGRTVTDDALRIGRTTADDAARIGRTTADDAVRMTGRTISRPITFKTAAGIGAGAGLLALGAGGAINLAHGPSIIPERPPPIIDTDGDGIPDTIPEKPPERIAKGALLVLLALGLAYIATKKETLA